MFAISPSGTPRPKEWKRESKFFTVMALSYEKVNFENRARTFDSSVSKANFRVANWSSVNLSTSTASTPREYLLEVTCMVAK
jgi:hypothetical protein